MRPRVIISKQHSKQLIITCFIRWHSPYTNKSPSTSTRLVVICRLLLGHLTDWMILVTAVISGTTKKPTSFVLPTSNIKLSKLSLSCKFIDSTWSCILLISVLADSEKFGVFYNLQHVALISYSGLSIVSKIYLFI